MNNIVKFINDFWISNESGDKKVTGMLQKLSSDSLADVYIGFSEVGNRCLFLKADVSGVVSAQNEKTNISLIIDRVNSLVYIELNDIYFGEVFNDLIVSIFSHIKDMQSYQSVQQFVVLFTKWNELFKSRISKKLLSERELYGLLGELFHLKKFLNNCNDANDINYTLDSWSGPDGKANDFIFADINHEVKTIEATKDFVDISSEYQLNCIEKPVLLVVYKSMRSNEGFSLSQIIDEIRIIIDRNYGDVERLLHKLNMFNIDFKNKNVYEDIKIEISKSFFYNTDHEDFPKITPGNLIQGINYVKYRINLSSIKNFTTQI
ncbi:Putative PD-(D/E)XK family member [Chryseobacterium oranimense]|uniref:Putative PD-(D/E)XK family member n=2 Tax=Chryseobacterium oranimense TaxID=421058 RepID=A0A1M5X5E0_9FLAO|nr:Putative PD-(D/E)XK family member [Chryseobacterium oranimense]